MSVGNETAAPLDGDIERARKVMDEAVDEIEPRNKARMNHPLRNKYRVKSRSSSGPKSTKQLDAPGSDEESHDDE